MTDYKDDGMVESRRASTSDSWMRGVLNLFGGLENLIKCGGRRLEREADKMRVVWGYISVFVLAFGFTAFAQQGAGEHLGDVFFDRGEFTLREDAKPVLAEDAEILAMNPGADVEIVGYCNTYEGVQDYNLGLKRAEAVRGFLVEHGVNFNRVSLGADCGGVGDEGNPSPGPAEVKAALDSRVSIKMNPRPEPGVL